VRSSSEKEEFEEKFFMRGQSSAGNMGEKGFRGVCQLSANSKRNKAGNPPHKSGELGRGQVKWRSILGEGGNGTSNGLVIVFASAK